MSTESAATYQDSVRAASYSISKSWLQPEVLRDLQRKNSIKGWTQVTLHIGLIVLCAAARWSQHTERELTDSWIVDSRSFLSLLLLIVQAMAMAFLFTGFHELTHLTVFSWRLPNLVVGNLFGFTIFRPFWHYTFYHYNHHKFTGDPAKDPELQDSFIDLRLDNVASYVCYLSGVPFWIDRSTTLFRHALLGWVLPREELFLTQNTKRTMLLEAKAYVATYALIAACCVWYPSSCFALGVWHLWVLPSLVAQPFLRFYLIAEHVGCQQGANMLSNTRTTKTFWWYRWLAWQMPFHSEHHAFPFIPFHQLPRLHEELKKQVDMSSFSKCDPDGEHGYLGVHIGIVRKFFGIDKKKSL